MKSGRAGPSACLAVVAALAATTVHAQTPTRLHGVIEKLDGTVLMAKSDKGDELKLNLASLMMVVVVQKATLADIKPGSFIGSGAMPQPDGSQKAIEVHIFAETMRGTGEGFRPWDGAPNSTMTNGTAGETVTGVNGPTITVSYKGGEQKIVVGPDVPIVKYALGDGSDLKPGAAFSILAAARQADGSYNINRINVGKNGLVPR